jgi:hypothetical protein
MAQALFSFFVLPESANRRTMSKRLREAVSTGWNCVIVPCRWFWPGRGQNAGHAGSCQISLQAA